MRRLFSVLLAVSALVVACGDTDPPPQQNNETACDECAPGERTCQGEAEVSTCVLDPDGCYRLTTITCPSGDRCVAGTCDTPERGCDDLCSPSSPPKCTRDGKSETCSSDTSSGCLEWVPRDCVAGETCNPASGECESFTCSDDCAESATQCQQDLIQTCARDAQGCLGFGPAKECPAGQVCQGDACAATTTCMDECEAGKTICAVDGGLRSCTDADMDGCTELGASMACPTGEACMGGMCVMVRNCQDACVANETVCVGNAIATCEMGAMGCLEFTNPTDCPGATETCQAMGSTVACVPAPVTGAVVLNEVFYDPVGSDMRGTGASAESPTFIELFGPAGFDIGGYTIELVNGSGGQVYGTFTLPAGARLDGNGFAVIAMDTPDAFLSQVLPFFTNAFFVLTPYGSGTDALQNGPDNIRLLDAGGTEVDALGWGNFSSATFVGEGSPAPDVSAGHSLGRAPGGTDTDDNAADFRSYYPTPSLPNQDLIINEAYFDQPGIDDGSETFVELMAPIVGWEDMPLDGYVLRAVNGFDGSDYIFSGILDGIELAGFSLNDVAGGEGYVVICNVDDVGLTLLSRCSALYEGVDFQNGPDNFVLEYNGQVIDSMGYGMFGATDVFVGEGTPATFWSSAEAGWALGRWSILDASVQLDTNDNYTDFWLMTPTPGRNNPLP